MPYVPYEPALASCQVLMVVQLFWRAPGPSSLPLSLISWYFAIAHLLPIYYYSGVFISAGLWSCSYQCCVLRDVLASELSILCLFISVCLLVFLYGAFCSCIELVFFVNELGVRVFVFSKLGGCEVVISSSGIQDAASWLRKCFDCWCSFMCTLDFLVFLLGLYMAIKAVACYSSLCVLFLCFVYTSFLSLSLFSFSWWGESYPLTVWTPRHYLTKEVQRSLWHAWLWQDPKKILLRSKVFRRPTMRWWKWWPAALTHCHYLGLTKRGHLFFLPHT